MLVKPNLENLLEKVGNRYTLSILAAKRARQLVDGALPLAKSDTPNNVTTACEEISNYRVFSTKGHVDVHVPLRPEILAERLAAKAELENERLQDEIEERINRAAEKERIERIARKAAESEADETEVDEIDDDQIEYDVNEENDMEDYDDIPDENTAAEQESADDIPDENNESEETLNDSEISPDSKQEVSENSDEEENQDLEDQ